MSLRRAVIRPFVLPLERPLETAHGPIFERAGWLVELVDREGRRGFGEAAPLPDFGTEDLGRCRLRLEQALAARIRNEREGPVPMDAPCARSAIDSAGFDLAARRASRTLAAEVRARAGEPGAPAESVRVQALVAGEDPSQVEANAHRLAGAGFDAFKLKLAVSRSRRDLGLDLERVGALRSAVGPACCLRLDANEAWSREEAAAALTALEPFDVDYVEQPIARDDLAGLKRLSESSSISLAADEALLGEGLAACLSMGAAQVLVVKPAAIGGLGPAISLWRRARSEGLRVVWSTLIDGAVGRAAPLALAAGLGPAEEIHGVGTAGLLAADFVPQPLDGRVSAGSVRISREAGIGFDPAIAESFARGREELGSVFEVEA